MTAYERERDDTSQAGGSSEHAGKSRGIQKCVCVCVPASRRMCVARAHMFTQSIKNRQCRVVHLHSGVLSAIQAAKVMIVFSTRYILCVVLSVQHPAYLPFISDIKTIYGDIFDT